MKTKLNVGLITVCSGRWPKELPNQRNSVYQEWAKHQNQFNWIFSDNIVEDQKSLEECTEKFRTEKVDFVVLVYGAFAGDDYASYLAEHLGVPILLWAPYEPPFTGTRLWANALVAGTMNSAALKRLGFKFYFSYGGKDDERSVKEVLDILNTYAVIKNLRNTTLGLLGYRPTAFYNCAFDEFLIRKTFGIRMEETDLKVIFDSMEKQPEDKVEADMKAISSRYDTSRLPEGHLENHSRLYLALQEVIKNAGYDYSVIKCWPEMGNLHTTPCAVLGRLSDMGIYIGCEGDVDATLAMIIENQFTHSGSFITDMINIDEKENTLTFWHCGNAGEKMMDPNSKAQICNHPLAGQGTAFWCTLKPGDITGARLCNIDGRYKLFVFEGEAVPTKMYTNGSMINVRIEMPVRDAIYKIINEGVAHHYSLCYGKIKDKMIMLANALGMDVIEL